MYNPRQAGAASLVGSSDVLISYGDGVEASALRLLSPEALALRVAA